VEDGQGRAARLEKWREMERAAVKAEAAWKRVGLEDNQRQRLSAVARQLRREADKEFNDMVQTISGWGDLA
jgi:hypothetical protein